MVALILFIIFGLLFGYFATMNTGLVTIYFGTYTLSRIPIYILVISAVAFGVIFASVFYWVKTLPAAIAYRKKEKELDDEKLKTAEWMKKSHQLELENTKLKTKAGNNDTDDDSI